MQEKLTDLQNKINSILSKLDQKINPLDKYNKIKNPPKDHPIIPIDHKITQQQLTTYIKNKQLINKNQYLSARILYLLQFKQNQKKQNKNLHPINTIIDQKNQTYQKYKYLKKQQQKLFLYDLGCFKENINLISQPSINNFQFYMNQSNISKLFQLRNNYRFLQGSHNYIQYMFPNHYPSRFNKDSKPMSYYQVSLFRQSKKLGLLLLKSALIFFNFLGLQLKQNYHFYLINQQRLINSLIKHPHNHLRLARLIACLSITGFRHMALQFIKFLGSLIQNNTFHKLTKTYKQQWEIYANTSKALQLCFHPDKQFPKQHQICQDIFINTSNKSYNNNYLQISQYQFKQTENNEDQSFFQCLCKLL